jgi:hypothetical protein
MLFRKSLHFLRLSRLSDLQEFEGVRFTGNVSNGGDWLITGGVSYDVGALVKRFCKQIRTYRNQKHMLYRSSIVLPPLYNWVKCQDTVHLASGLHHFC